MGTLRRPRALRSHPPRGAREPRRQDRGRARARRAGRRDDQPFLAAAEHRCHAPSGLDHDSDGQQLPTLKTRIGRAQRVVGDRSPGGLRAGASAATSEHDRHRRRRARRPSARADRRRDELLHAGRRAAPARDGACDLGGTGRDAASRHRAAARGPRVHVRRRARADGRVECAGSDTAARNAGRRLAAPDRRADRRSGVECHGGHRPLERHRGRSGRQPGQPATLLERRPDLLASRAQLEAANCGVSRRRRSGSRASSSAPCSARQSVETERDRPRRGALHQRLGPADDADLQLGTDARDQRNGRERAARSIAALRGRDRARARGCRERAGRAARRTPTRRSPAERRRLGGRGARPCAVTLRPRPDRPPAAARCAAHAPDRPDRRQRQQHAAAARQRAALQGARRRLGGLRTRRHPRENRL